MVNAVAEVVVAPARIGAKAAGGGTHAVAIGPFDDARSGAQGGTADGVIFGASPKTQDHEIRGLALPPGRIADFGRGDPEDWFIEKI